MFLSNCRMDVFSIIFTLGNLLLLNSLKLCFGWQQDVRERISICTAIAIRESEYLECEGRYVKGAVMIGLV